MVNVVFALYGLAILAMFVAGIVYLARGHHAAVNPWAFSQWTSRAHGINFITLADENPTTLPDLWRSFLEEIVARKLLVRFFATIRATDIVRDRGILHLYREAGILYVLMGVESTDDEVLRQIQKGSTTSTVPCHPWLPG